MVSFFEISDLLQSMIPCWYRVRNRSQLRQCVDIDAGVDSESATTLSRAGAVGSTSIPPCLSVGEQIKGKPFRSMAGTMWKRCRITCLAPIPPSEGMVLIWACCHT
jgi:hypothetical protein